MQAAKWPEKELANPAQRRVHGSGGNRTAASRVVLDGEPTVDERIPHV
jgi:hypothetical protein